MRPSLALVALVLVPVTAGAGAAAGAATPGAAPGPRVAVMVVGRSRVLAAPRTVAAGPTTLSVDRRRCSVAAGTPLAALAARRRVGGPGFALVDYGSCGARPSSAAGLYVREIAGDRAAGQNGWVYKVGRRVGTAAAADPGGPFGAGRLRSGQNVLWFYCRMTRRGGCQRTLELTAPTPSVSPGAPVAVLVRGYDDSGRGVAVAGAVVRLGRRSTRTAGDGRAVLAAPATPGRALLSATRAGAAPGFPLPVTVR